MDKEGERMKRTTEKNEEENEEEKIEKFFALVRSTRVARDCISGKMDRINDGEELRKVANDDKKLKTPAAAVGWFPTFQPEDFVADFRAKPAAAHATQPGPSNITTTTATTTITTTIDNVNEGGKEERGDDNLDLKLSL